MTRSYAALRAFCALLAAGCSAEIGTTGGTAAPAMNMTCLAGTQVACTCPDHSAGIAICDASGHGLGACMCHTQLAAPFTGAPVAGQGAAGAGVATFAPDVSIAAAGAAAPTMTVQAARGIRIAQLAWYQPVKTPLVAAGAEVTDRNAPVVAGKRALLRVFVETLPGFTARDLNARLALVSAGGSAPELSVTQRVSGNSTDADLKSSLNFDIPADRITEDTRYRVSLEEASAGGDATLAIDPRVRWPLQEGELAELGARDPGSFRLVVVPYRYQGDKSGRLPAADETEMNAYRAYLQQMYPASKIELSVHAPVDYTAQIGPDSGWEEWLDTHCSLRQKEAPDPKVFYYGMIAPRATWKDYGGGIAGISNVPSAAANFGRCSVGIGFAGFAFVAAHELGHALGLEHAPCGTSGGPFPYQGALIGVWGYDGTAGKLIAPDKAHDLMSYCDPPFMSDYNYGRLFERIRYLNAQFYVAPSPEVTYYRVLVDHNGVASVRGTVSYTSAPGGSSETRSVGLVDASGQVVGESDAYFFPFSEAQAGIALIPDSGLPVVRIAGVGDVRLY